MFRSVRRQFSTDLAIDLGTASTLITSRQGIVLDIGGVDPPRGPLEKTGPGGGQGKPKAMLEQVPGNIEAIRPMKDSVIADFANHRANVSGSSMVHPRSMFQPSPRIIICVPCGSTQVETA
jgi:rod shape-determining protein MreB